MRVLKRALLVFLGLGVLGAISWIGYYGYRSSSGGYREIAHPGGVVTAVWCPVDLHVTDFPLLVVDRWFFHEPVTTVTLSNFARRKDIDPYWIRGAMMTMKLGLDGMSDAYVSTEVAYFTPSLRRCWCLRN